MARTMKQDKETSDWGPDKRITWAIFTLLMVVTALLAGGLATLVASPRLGGNWFWIGVGVGLLRGLMVNVFRPKYDCAGRCWKAIFEFLLEQMSPPD